MPLENSASPVIDQLAVQHLMIYVLLRHCCITFLLTLKGWFCLLYPCGATHQVKLQGSQNFWLRILFVLMYSNSLARHFSSMFHAKCLLPRLDRLLLVRSCLQNFYQCLYPNPNIYLGLRFELGA